MDAIIITGEDMTEAIVHAARSYLVERIAKFQEAGEEVYGITGKRDIQIFMDGAHLAATFIITDFEQGNLNFTFVRPEDTDKP